MVKKYTLRQVKELISGIDINEATLDGWRYPKSAHRFKGSYTVPKFIEKKGQYMARLQTKYIITDEENHKFLTNYQILGNTEAETLKECYSIKIKLNIYFNRPADVMWRKTKYYTEIKFPNNYIIKVDDDKKEEILNSDWRVKASGEYNYIVKGSKELKGIIDGTKKYSHFYEKLENFLVDKEEKIYFEDGDTSNFQTYNLTTLEDLEENKKPKSYPEKDNLILDGDEDEIEKLKNKPFNQMSKEDWAFVKNHPQYF